MRGGKESRLKIVAMYFVGMLSRSIARSRVVVKTLCMKNVYTLKEKL